MVEICNEDTRLVLQMTNEYTVNVFVLQMTNEYTRLVLQMTHQDTGSVVEMIKQDTGLVLHMTNIQCSSMNIMFDVTIKMHVFCIS